ncbi:MAG: sigma-70 family RNA polymerase sigma factor, partial [Clostridia bacterium]|nr:sigma-70 family RNA polymerase sigma factor [Clostridia bacterium]
MSLDNARYDAAALALRRWSADLVRFAYSYLLNHADAQDAVQDAFVSYMKHAPVFSDPEASMAWLIRVTATKCKKMLRSG